MKKNTIIVGLSISVVLLAGVLSSCSSKQQVSTTKQIKTIYIGTQNDYPPFCYRDNSGKLTGYDVEVINDINKKLDGYKFVIKDSSWDSIFPSLETNKIQIVADEIAKNPEREQKYLFSDVPYFDAQSVIIAKKGRTPKIKSLKDLEGLTVAASPGDSYTQILEKYNSQHGNKIKLKYIDADVPTILQDIQAGRVDAYVNDPVMTKAIIKKYSSLEVEIVGKAVQNDNIYLVFTKTNEGKELKAKIDPIIKGLKADGTLNKLSTKWTGGEYIPK